MIVVLAFWDVKGLFMNNYCIIMLSFLLEDNTFYFFFCLFFYFLHLLFNVEFDVFTKI